MIGAEHVPVVQRRCGDLQNMKTGYFLEVIAMDIVRPLQYVHLGSVRLLYEVGGGLWHSQPRCSDSG